MRFMLHYSLDIDDTIADFSGHILQYFDVPDKSDVVMYDDCRIMSRASQWWKDRNFWLTMPRMEDPSMWRIKPSCYLTARSIDEEITKEWLRINKFPDAPLIATKGKIKKASILNVTDENPFKNIPLIDYHLDDNVNEFEDINCFCDHTICCLRDFSFNRSVNTDLRVNSVYHFLQKYQV